ncbi:MAG: PAS domain S-box protein [Bacteroidetes bacterium]|nr:PAS domain S-box protein [Bacteroidota bacterium]
MDINKLTKAALKQRVKELGLKLQKQSEETIHKNVEAFKLSEEIASLGYYERNWLTGKDFWSAGFYKLLGVQEGEVECTHEVLTQFLHPDDRDRFEKHIRKALLVKTEMNIEFKLVQKNRNIIYVQGNGKTKYSEKGEPLLTIGVFQDITERKKAEADLIKAKEKAEESELKFKSIYENVPVGIFRSTPSGKLISANPAFLDIYGFKNQQDLQETPAQDFYYDEEDRDNLLQRLKTEGTVKNYITKERKKDGSVIWIESDYRATLNDQGEIIYIDGNLQDITERKRIENELIKAKEKAEESDSLKSAFLANMSHEIRTPMNGIIGFSEMFLRSHFDDEKRNNYAQIVVDSSRQLLNIVDDILDISMIDSNNIRIIKSEVAINSILQEVCEIFKPQFKKSGISFHLSNGLSDEESTIETDKERLKQVISKLLNNALKFTPKGSVEFGYTLKQGTLQFYVEDTGIGIPSKDQDRIFERFQQAEIDPTRVYGGTGLGLTIAKKLVSLLGGEIGVESEKEHGARFYFTIPYTPLKNTKTKSKKQSMQNETKKLTIVVAEDEELNYLFIEEVLSELDITLIHTKDGQETVKVCNENPFIDLVLMDLKMPIMDGLEATKRIKKLKPELPIIAQTAYALAGDKEKARKAGCNGYLAKPIDANELLNTVNKILNI